MGAGTGFERSLLPRMAVLTFHQQSAATRLNFVATFGLSKAVANAFSGPLADKFGRKPTLVLGFLIGLPVMPYVIVAKSWTGITAMNIAFGLSQGLLGSALFFLLIDLLGPKRRGIAVGFGECMIYVSTALVNILAGRLASRYGFRPVPFYVATGFAVVGLISTIPLKDTLDKVREEQTASQRRLREKYARMASIQPSVLDEEQYPPLGARQRFYTKSLNSRDDKEVLQPLMDEIKASYSAGGTRENCGNPQDEYAENTNTKEDGEIDATEEYNAQMGLSLASTRAGMDEPDPPLLALKNLLFYNPNYVALCFTGMVINFKDGFAWGSFPVFFAHEYSLSDKDTDFLVALYPLCWGFAQAFTGALSDRFGRQLFLITGTAACVISMALYPVAGTLWGEVGDSRHILLWTFCDVLLGIGTAFAYPALQAGAADEVDPINRGVALGFYRFIRDMGYVVGALVCGRLTDALGYDITFYVVAFVMGLSLLSMTFIYVPRFDSSFSVRSSHFPSVRGSARSGGIPTAFSYESLPSVFSYATDITQNTVKFQERPTYVERYSDSM